MAHLSREAAVPMVALPHAQEMRGRDRTSGCGLPHLLSPAKPLSGKHYDTRLADEAVDVRRLLVDPQFWALVGTVLKFVLELVGERLFVRRRCGRDERLSAQAARIRRLLVDLGPTYVKVGQFLSMRRDLLPAAVADQLSQLQDAVPPFSAVYVRQSIIGDLGRAPEQLFSVFEPKPIASASIGQVHRAKLHDGSWVVVKVQRPDLAQRFYRDLGCMRLVARVGRFLGAGERAHSWLSLIDEFGRVLFDEIDYIQEGRNADRLRRSLRYRPRVKIPRVIWQYTGRRVLTLEYLPGTKIDNLDELARRRVDLRDLANFLVDCYLEQVLLNGFFHADPHAGNLAVDGHGRLVIYDFGVMGEVSDGQKAAFAGCVKALVAADPDRAASHLKELGLVRPGAHGEPLVRALSEVIACYRGKDILDLDFASLEKDVDSLIADRAFQLPPTLASLLRAGSSIDGLARTIRPGFNFAQAARRAVGRLASRSQPGWPWIDAVPQNPAGSSFAGLSGAPEPAGAAELVATVVG